jgi:peptidoglycan/LPS O-acetylase OafA/YrhL
MEVKKYGYIDALRGLAILPVLLVHTGRKLAGHSDLMDFITFKGQYGVQLFFIASALTLFLSFEQRKKIDLQNTTRYFLIRRFFRIDPAFYLAILIYTLDYWIRPLSGFPNPVNIGHVLLSFFFMNGFSVKAINYVPPGGWSVAIEMLFYFFIPVLFSRIKQTRQAIILFFITVFISLLANFAGRWMLTDVFPVNAFDRKWFLYFWLPNQMPVFMLGVCLFHVLQHPVSVSRLTANLLTWISLLAMIPVFYLVQQYDVQGFFPEHLVIAVLFSVIVFAMSQAKISLLDNRFTRYLGKISFSMYLFHFIVLDVCAAVWKRIAFGSPVIQLMLLYGITLLLSILVSLLSYRLIERNGVRYGARLIEKLNMRRTVVTGKMEFAD